MSPKKRKTVSHRRVRKTGSSFKRRIPAWSLWIGGGVAALGYVYAFYFFFVGPFSFRWKAFYGDINYPKGYSIHGIDVSRYQGEIDWGRLRQANIAGNAISFVIMKATEGNTFVDAYFQRNFEAAKSYNFIRGAYHFYTPSVPANQQVQHFLSQVQLEEGDLPPVFDIEDVGTLTVTQVKKEALTWLTMVENHYHVKPILYTSYKFKLKYLSDSIFDTFPYWIAHYHVDSVRYTGKWRFWQYTDRGTLDGIKGSVDFDVYNGSMYDLQRFTLPAQKEKSLYR